MAPQPFRPMPLVRNREPFDHPDWIFEVKHDGFRAVAHIDRHHCELRSRNGHTFNYWPQLSEELAHAVKEKGGPDKRFSSNRLLLVMLYEEVHVTSSSGLNEVVQVSRQRVLEPFATALRGMYAATPTLKEAESASP